MNRRIEGDETMDLHRRVSQTWQKEGKGSRGSFLQRAGFRGKEVKDGESPGLFREI